MDEYSALAQRLAVSVGDVRGCLILSRDGLVLGAYPDDSEAAAKPAWLKFTMLGEPEKSFVEFPDQIWVFCRRGPYAAFAVAGTGVRPGVLIDQMEQALLSAEDARTRREPLKVPDVTSAPSGKPRTSLHPPSRTQPAPVNPEGEATEAAADESGSTAADPAPEGTQTPASHLQKEPRKMVSSKPADEDDVEVDRVLLAQEFSGLLQVDQEGDEGRS